MMLLKNISAGPNKSAGSYTKLRLIFFQTFKNSKQGYKSQKIVEHAHLLGCCGNVQSDITPANLHKKVKG